jgi:hypothetical protein
MACEPETTLFDCGLRRAHSPAIAHLRISRVRPPDCFALPRLGRFCVDCGYQFSLVTRNLVREQRQ